MRVWRNSLNGCTRLHSTLFLPGGILVKRDTQRWRPLIKLIKRPSKLDKRVLRSPENRLLGSGWQVPLCHVRRVSLQHLAHPHPQGHSPNQR